MEEKSNSIAGAPKAPLDGNAQGFAASPFALDDQFLEASQLFASHDVGVLKGNADVLICVDTSVLLLPYKLGGSDLSDIVNVYRLLAKEKRLFLPARVAREFIRLRDQHLADIVKAAQDQASQIKEPAKLPPLLLSGLEEFEKIENLSAELTAARTEYLSALRGIIGRIKAWRGNDPVSDLYREVFEAEQIVELEESQKALETEWQKRLRNKTPPGYKDGAKADTGIGDFLVWKSILKVGIARQKDIVLVTNEAKSDWFVRGGNEPIFPRPELVAEFRRESRGRNIRLMSLADLLREFDAKEEVVRDVQQAERTRQNLQVPESALANLQSLSNEQVRTWVGEHALAMRIAETESRERESRARGDMRSENWRAASEQARAELERYYSTQLLPVMQALHSELCRRLGITIERFNMDHIALHGSLAGPRPLADAAAYLEELARQLPA